MNRALLVASSTFEETALPALGDAPGNDIQSLKTVLGNGDFHTKCIVDVSSHEVAREVEAFCVGASQDDLLVLYFSTHGIRDERDVLGPFYLACCNTELSHLLSTSLPAALVNNCMNYSLARRQVLILDCCYSGAFAQGLVSRGMHGPNEDRQSSADLGKAFGWGQGRIVLTATDKVRAAWQTRTQSIFNRHLIAGLKGAADTDGDGWVSVYELYQYVHPKVIQEMPEQPPQLWVSGGEGQILLVRSQRGGQPPEPGEPPPETGGQPPDTTPIRVRSSYVRRRGKIQWKYLHDGGYEHYRVRISLEGTDDQLNEVKRVTYKLDPSFPNPNRPSRSRVKAFAIEIWTYAGFSLKAEIVFRDNTTITIPYRLKLNLPRDEDEYEEADD